MPLTPALIQFDNGQAVREGWDVFETNRPGAPLEIQRNDEDSSFDDDGEALTFVFNSAFDGSDYHKVALALHLGLYTMTEATPAGALDRPAREAVIKATCTGALKGTAFVRWTKVRGWACTLSNGIPASMSYAGVAHGEETATVVALERAKTVGDVLRIMQARTSAAIIELV